MVKSRKIYGIRASLFKLLLNFVNSTETRCTWCTCLVVVRKLWPKLSFHCNSYTLAHMWHFSEQWTHSLPYRAGFLDFFSKLCKRIPDLPVQVATIGSFGFRCSLPFVGSWNPKKHVDTGNREKKQKWKTWKGDSGICIMTITVLILHTSDGSNDRIWGFRCLAHVALNKQLLVAAELLRGEHGTAFLVW